MGVRVRGGRKTKRKISVYHSQSKDPFFLYSKIRKHTVSTHFYPDMLILEKGISRLTAPASFVYLAISGKYHWILKSAYFHKIF